MIISLFKYEYTCQCGHIFYTYNLIGEHSYGEFIMKSEIDELVYLNAFKAKEFDEFSSLLKKNKKLKNKNKNEIAEIFHIMFTLVCDLSPQGKLYFMDKHPNCPKCLSPYHMASWTPIYPYEVVEMDIKEITFHKWKQLNGEGKNFLIEKGLGYALKIVEEKRQFIRDSPPWPTLSKTEKEKNTRTIVDMEERNFKYMLSEFRMLKGLDVVSPIG